MKIKTLLIAILLTAFLLPLAPTAQAVCTQHGTVGITSTAIVGANDIVAAALGVQGRHYLLIQNTGQTVGMYVAIGSANTATTQDMYLGPNASWTLTMAGGAMVPGGDVAAISTGAGTSYAFCDY